MPNSSFAIQRPIKQWGKQTYVNWNLGSPRKAVVFIHGFNGSSLKTFGDFNLEFRHRPEYKDYDVYFYGYDSLNSQVGNSALSFMTFLHALNTDIKSVIKNSGASLQRSRYEKIVVVAHSLGAVVTRQALNDAHRRKYKWVHQVNLVLFAPAHKGARNEILDLIELGGILRFIKPFVLYRIVTVGQLMGKGNILPALETDCRKLIYEEKIKTFTIAVKVVWADPERVVFNEQFLDDDPSTQCTGKKHEEVCKPGPGFETPFNIVKEVLEA